MRILVLLGFRQACLALQAATEGTRSHTCLKRAVYAIRRCSSWSVSAPVICIPGPPRAGDSGAKAPGFTSDEHRQCRGFNFPPIHGAHFESHDILMLGKSPIKWRHRPDMTIAVDWDFKHQFKQAAWQPRKAQGHIHAGLKPAVLVCMKCNMMLLILECKVYAGNEVICSISG